MQQTYDEGTEGRRYPAGAAAHSNGAFAQDPAPETRIVAIATFAHACSLQILSAKGWRWEENEGIKIQFRGPIGQ
jgi:hypothetical protein